jgi:class 3 adenylate cyclase
MGKVRRRQWVWHFDRPVDAIWEILADTARFNEAAKLPKHEIIETPQPDGSVLYFGRIKRGPFTLEWRERPVNWIHDRWFEHRREFRNGPLKSLCATFELEPEADGCRGRYTIAVEPRNPIGELVLLAGFFRNAGKIFGQLAKEAGDYAGGRRAEPFHYDPPPPGEATRRRLDAIVRAIEATPNGHGLGRKLADYVTSAQEVDLWHLRPLKLARSWRANPRQVIEACLQAVKSGLLELRWDLLCPRCRVAKASTSSLDRLPTGAHCPTCNIDYERDFSKNVEAAFRPTPAIRPLAGGEYCLFGPMSTPHIKLHVTLGPGETRRFAVDLPFGPYRLRTLEPGPETDIDWSAGGFPEAIFEAERASAGPPAMPGSVVLTNRESRPITAIVEDRSWAADALTADRITTIQAFRDLFASDVLRPGDDVGVGEITLMFSDLKGSTAFYERVGDAKAYNVVREHFAFLAGIVREHEGAIVKTIGDAVMAAFFDPAAAVRAAIAIQRKVAAFNAAHGEGAIAIKLGLHVGPCIAVTLNDRLDYFGSAVNLAARLQGKSLGGDIVISEALARDAAARRVLAPYAMTDETAEIRGFDRPARFRRLTEAAIAAVPEAAPAGDIAAA